MEGQEHYFAKPLDYYIDILNSPNNSLNSFSITSYCKYHPSNEIVVIDANRVSVLQTFTISKLSDKKRNNYRESGTGDETSSSGNSGGSGGGSNISIDKKNSFYHLKGPSTNFHRYQAATVR